MKNLAKLGFLVFFLLCNSQAIIWAYPSSNHCEPIPFKIADKNIILPGDSENSKISQIYFFRNKSEQSVFIDYHHPNRSASAGWSTYLRPQNWSVLALNKKNFPIQCSTIEPGKVVTLNCATTIEVCRPKNLQIKSPIKGNFWIVEDKSWEVVLKHLDKKGISLQ